jgi:putative YhdH/YhfP family quinone oxidoreductase
MGETFRAIVAEQVEGTYTSELRELAVSELPDNDVLVDVEYSTLNYKDGLAVTGKGKICRSFPMVCGCDLAGTVAESAAPAFKPGDKVVLNGYGMSETQWGGYSQKARVKSEHLMKLPPTISTKEAMAIGTAGYTAMLCVLALERHQVEPETGQVLVTGAAGGVGSVSVALLSKLGYSVAASTGRSETQRYLAHLGASSFIDRAELAGTPRPFAKERWAGAVDSVGSNTLANVLAQTAYGGCVAACGLAAGPDLPGSVLPFILRGVTLAGIDSVMAPMKVRLEAWQRLATDLDKVKLSDMTTVEPLGKVPELARAILQGQTRGRVVIDVNA